MSAESHEKFIPSAILLRDRGTVMIREDGTRSPATFPMYESSQRRSDSRKENPSLDLDTLMASENVENMVMTREDENEVDKLVDEFEIIDAISQLSPENAEVRSKQEPARQSTMEETINKGSASKTQFHPL
ncbi:hypothetical protein YC2023_002474 [Brassica napus]